MRWRTPGLIVAVAAGAIAYVRLGGEQQAQSRNLASYGIGFLAALLMLLWVLFGSGLRRGARLSVLAAVVFAVAFLFGLFRIRGVTGDFVPVIEPRWIPKETVAAMPLRPPLPAPATTLGAATVASLAPKPAPSASPVPVAIAASAPINDYPQFLGPSRDGTLAGVKLARDWAKRPPRRVWRQPIGLGWSAFAIAGTRAVTQEQRGALELVTAYDLATGRALWAHSDTVRFESVVAGAGPRAVPTLEGGRVFTVGSTGLLNALDLETGRRLWSKDFVRDNGAEVPSFGKVTAPLVVGDLVIVSAGGGAGRSLVSYKKDTGERAWSAGDDVSGYGSLALVSLLGRRQVLAFNGGSVVAHDPENGSVLWQHAWPRGQPNVAQPLPIGDDRVLLSAGYGVGSKLFQVSQAPDGAYAARLVWETSRLKSKFVNMVLVDGFVYGLDDGILACLDPASGERKWKSGRYGHGQMILVERTLLLQSEEGELVLIDPDPGGLKELARFQALDGKTWNPPALAAPYLVVRNDKEAACYELPLER